ARPSKFPGADWEGEGLQEIFTLPRSDADDEAARITRNPLALARALLKVYLGHAPSRVSPDGGGVGLARAFLTERIERLLTIAEEMGLQDDPSLAERGSSRAIC
ncbi:MAG: hypothetical protein V3W22_04265, partial [Thermoplasmata archaeon]